MASGVAHAPQYIALFVVGLVAYRRNWLETFTEAQARPWRWIALIFILLLPALVVAAGALTGKLDERGAGGLNWLSLAYSLWEGFMCVSMVIVVLAWFRKRFDHQGRLAKVMSDNCFAVYILHPLIIVPLALALSGIQLNLGLQVHTGCAAGGDAVLSGGVPRPQDPVRQKRPVKRAIDLER